MAATTARWPEIRIPRMPRLPGRAACAGVDPEMFQEHRGVITGGQLAEAREVCDQCPYAVRRVCLAWAVVHRETGIWAGTTPEERKAMRTSSTLRAKARTSAA